MNNKLCKFLQFCECKILRESFKIRSFKKPIFCLSYFMNKDLEYMFFFLEGKYTAYITEKSKSNYNIILAYKKRFVEINIKDENISICLDFFKNSKAEKSWRIDTCCKLKFKVKTI